MFNVAKFELERISYVDIDDHLSIHHNTQTLWTPRLVTDSIVDNGRGFQGSST